VVRKWQSWGIYKGRETKLLFENLYDSAWEQIQRYRKNANIGRFDGLLWHVFYPRFANSLPQLTRTEERELERRWNKHQDHSAHEELVLCQLRIVPAIAGKIANEFGYQPWPGSGRAAWDGYETLIHELTCAGNLGLLLATDRFCPELGWRFSTHANFWIKKLIREEAKFLRSNVTRPKRVHAVCDLSFSGYQTRIDNDGKEYTEGTALDVGSLEEPRLTRRIPARKDSGVGPGDLRPTIKLQGKLAEGFAGAVYDRAYLEATPEAAAAAYRLEPEPWELDDIHETAEHTAKRVLTIVNIGFSPRVILRPASA
jgi:hypothetical protein